MQNQHKVLRLNNYICSFSDKTEPQHMAECSPCLASTIQLHVLRTAIYSPGLHLSCRAGEQSSPTCPRVQALRWLGPPAPSGPAWSHQAEAVEGLIHAQVPPSPGVHRDGNAYGCGSCITFVARKSTR